jgi:AcrR family transcriptional regulator
VTFVQTRGDVTREALIETAERLFAEQGIETVSLRDVSKAAGQRNHSAAQYHFGDRAGLVAAVYEHRMRHVNERRHAMLELADRDDLRALVAAIVEPLAVVVAETAGWYGRFLARTQWDPFAQQVVRELPVLSSYRRATRLLAGALPDVPADVRRIRFEQMTNLLIGTIAGWEWQRHRGQRTLPIVALHTDLTITVTAVLTAPSTSTTETR